MGILNFIYNSISSKNVKDRQKQLISALCSINPAFKVTVKSENEVILKNLDSDTEIKLEQFFYSKNTPLYVSCNTQDDGDTIDFTIEYKEPIIPLKVIKDLTETLAKKHSELELQRSTYPLSNQEQELLLSIYTLKILKEASSEDGCITEEEHYVRDFLNAQQVRALFGIIVSLCYSCYIPIHRHELILELANYAYVLSIVLIPLLEFEKIHGYARVVGIVNNTTGDYEDICLFINNKSEKTYIGFSPYLGKPSTEEIIDGGSNFFVQYNYKEGCYFLCTKDSNEYRMENSDLFPYCEDERCLEQMLIDLNVNHNINNYTVG